MPLGAAGSRLGVAASPCANSICELGENAIEDAATVAPSKALVGVPPLPLGCPPKMPCKKETCCFNSLFSADKTAFYP